MFVRCRGLLWAAHPVPVWPTRCCPAEHPRLPLGREKLSTCAAMGTNAVRGVTAVSPGKGQTPRGSTRFICCAHWLVRHQRGWKGTDLTGLLFVRSCQDGAQPAHVCIFRCDPLGTEARGTKYRKTTRPGSAEHTLSLARKGLFAANWHNQTWRVDGNNTATVPRTVRRPDHELFWQQTPKEMSSRCPPVWIQNFSNDPFPVELLTQRQTPRSPQEILTFSCEDVSCNGTCFLFSVSVLSSNS